MINSYAELATKHPDWNEKEPDIEYVRTVRYNALDASELAENVWKAQFEVKYAKFSDETYNLIGLKCIMLIPDDAFEPPPENISVEEKLTSWLSDHISPYWENVDASDAL